MRFDEPTPCGSCGALVRWALLSGSAHPFDAEPVAGGDHVVEWRGRSAVAFHVPAAIPGSLTLPGLELEDERERYVSHFVTCPNADEWRGAA